MLEAATLGSLELRAEGGETRLRATFPYGREAVLSDGGATGRPRIERFAARAFDVRGDRNVYLLAGHDFDRPLASVDAGTLTLTESDEALALDARISPDLTRISYVGDILAAHRAGLVRGLSPGFRVRPGGERVEERGDAILRTVTSAELLELSIVTRPAYPGAQVEARNRQPISDVARRMIEEGPEDWQRLMRCYDRWR